MDTAVWPVAWRLTSDFGRRTQVITELISKAIGRIVFYLWFLTLLSQASYSSF